MLEKDDEKYQTGFIRLWRSFTRWEWYDDIPVKVLFLHMLLKANHKNKKWHGIVIPRGSFITSRSKLSRETGLSERQVRTAIVKLISTSEVTSKTTSQNTMITIKNYDVFQKNDQVNDQRATSERPASDQRATTTNNNNNDNNDNNSVCINNLYTSKTKIHSQGFSFNKDFSSYGEYGNVYLTDSQLREFECFVGDKAKANEIINDFSENIASNREKIFNPDFPQMHFIRLKKYWMNYKKRPQKNESISNEEIVARVFAEAEKKRIEREKKNEKG